MVDVQTYGIWEQSQYGYKKELEGNKILLEYESNYVYCFVQINNNIIEFHGEPNNAKSTCEEIMRRESDIEEGIIDILEDIESLERMN